MIEVFIIGGIAVITATNFIISRIDAYYLNYWNSYTKRIFKKTEIGYDRLFQLLSDFTQYTKTRYEIEPNVPMTRNIVCVQKDSMFRRMWLFYDNEAITIMCRNQEIFDEYNNDFKNSKEEKIKFAFVKVF